MINSDDDDSSDILNTEDKSHFKNCDYSNDKINTDLKTKSFKLINHFRSKNQLSDLLLNEMIKCFGEFISREGIMNGRCVESSTSSAIFFFDKYFLIS